MADKINLKVFSDDFKNAMGETPFNAMVAHIERNSPALASKTDKIEILRMAPSPGR
jgi:hypothetical protein